MKPGRNEPCPCGSGKKYKRCCMDSISKQHASMLDDIKQVAAMNPNLSLEELNIVAEQKMRAANERPHPDFCGLSPTQMSNWLYASFKEVEGVTIHTPDDLRTSPVMRYLALILDEAMQSDGSFKATSKGNLPTKIVKQANELLPEFAVSQFERHISISEYAGSNEDKFNALHYSRILAEIAGIIYRRSGRYHVKKSAQKQYLNHGIQAFFTPMLEAATTQYNWGYLDGWEQDIDLRTFWLFMLWRIQSHGNTEQLIEEVITAFPDLLLRCPEDGYMSPSQLLGTMIESRFIKRFLEFWGLVTVAPFRHVNELRMSDKLEIQPLMKLVFQFDV
ncbi:YecA family protein [Vibrio breoganii]|uniref:YecA family protein n=1 Tax=Vibrio breoganii TaxID=553239 RepID=UPI000C81E26E|nr:SEC-C domain-containing protein [Vibrio breoganii]PMI22495.1 SecC motif-containing protein [Vibrio breoganii]PML15660.1 SecC motif-containing protein [Vibrio breoganii]PML36675.1 SecC motif-containing protein [Vibrio breoganii]PML37690.1 SecC motif-containing protein [Vibrio breoganii]PMO74581.1 SecC motif-containing protein [Vibrio breoganii]